MTILPWGNVHCVSRVKCWGVTTTITWIQVGGVHLLVIQSSNSHNYNKIFYRLSLHSLSPSLPVPLSLSHSLSLSAGHIVNIYIKRLFHYNYLQLHYIYRVHYPSMEWSHVVKHKRYQYNSSCISCFTKKNFMVIVA